MFERMISAGFVPNVVVYDCLLKGFDFLGDTEEIISLLQQMAANNVVLDSKITSTILMCLSNVSGDVNVAHLLPSFTREIPKACNTGWKELLTKLDKSLPKLMECSS